MLKLLTVKVRLGSKIKYVDNIIKYFYRFDQVLGYFIGTF